MSYKYKNISDSEQSLIGFGVVDADAEIETDRVIENPNFKYVGTGDSPVINAIAEPQDNAVTEANIVEDTSTETKES